MTHDPAPWHPRSGFERVGGYVWLGRMLDKARRSLEDPLGSYLLFGASPIDAAALRHFRTTGDELLAWIREGRDDAAIAEALAERTGESLERRAAWSRRFLWIYGLFIAGTDADEGRLPPGPRSALLKGLSEVGFLIVSRLPRPAR